MPFPLDDIARLGADVPVLADVEPSGSQLMPDFDAGGGVPSLLREISGLLDLDATTVAGQSIGEITAAARPASGAIRPASSPLRDGGAFGVVRGSLAPDGAVIKTSAASERLLRHRGPAVVFRGYDDMLARIDDPGLPVTAGQRARAGRLRPGRRPRHARVGHDPDPGPAGPGRRDRHGAGHRRPDERHQLRHRAAARRAGGGRRRPARPGPRRRPDQRRRARPARSTSKSAEAELDSRRAALAPPRREHLRGWPALYAQHVMQAPDGCDLDFLRAPTAAHRSFVEPVVGRS